MPPPESNLSLSTAEKELLRRWIADGAQVHRALGVSPAAGERCRCPRCTMRRGRGSRSIASCSPGWKPKNWSRRRRPTPLRLLRRLTLDLTGLPPTRRGNSRIRAAAANDVDAALAAAVDRLLASPAFGEHMAVAVARRGALRRLVRLPVRPAQHAVALPRLGRPGAQRQPAVRRVPHLAARRRPAAATRRATRSSPRRSTACTA